MDQYQGWTNYPTWAVQVWLNLNRRAWFTKLVTDDGLDLEQKADILETYVQERNPLIDDETMFCECLAWALGLVNYREIIERSLTEKGEK
jgi:hypothetical protein